MNKLCIYCNQIKSLEAFSKQNTFDGYATKCKACKKTYDAQLRQLPNKRARFILNDSNRYDKERNLFNNLTLDSIQSIISSGCFYCERTNTTIGLDRIDNSKGHLLNNVIASCTRCNFLRGTMPYDAWMLLVPGLKQAVKQGLLDNWTNTSKLL